MKPAWRKPTKVAIRVGCTCLPPCAHTNRVGNTICSYIACCAMAAGPLSAGASVVRRARVQ